MFLLPFINLVAYIKPIITKANISTASLPCLIDSGSIPPRSLAVIPIIRMAPATFVNVEPILSIFLLPVSNLVAYINPTIIRENTNTASRP